MVRRTSKATRGKVLVTVSTVGAAAAVAGLGTFGTFNSVTSASSSVATGTVAIALGGAGGLNELSVAATGLVPGDTVERAADLSVSGDQDLSGVTLTTTAPTSSVLDSDAVNGLQLAVDMCSVPWTETGTAPIFTYTCGGTQTPVVAARPVIGSNVALPGAALAAGSSTHLRVTLSLPTTADNTFQGKSSVISFAFTGTQRTGTNR